MRLLQCCLLLVSNSLLCIALETSTGALAQEAAGTLKVMSFNIRYGTAPDGVNHWVKRRELLISVIQKFGPDLLGTQEALAHQRDALMAAMPEYEGWSAGRDDGKEKGEMAALFWRKRRFEKLDGGHFWLSPKPYEPGSKGWDAALPRIASWVKLKDRLEPSVPAVLFVNTHFDHRGGTARLESAQLLRQRIKELAADGPVIVTGDFNAAEGSPPHAALFATSSSPRLVDVFRQRHPQKQPQEGTFHGFQPAKAGAARIDWIGCTPNFRVVDAGIDRTTVEGRAPSDHFPVTAILAWQTGKS